MHVKRLILWVMNVLQVRSCKDISTKLSYCFAYFIPNINAKDVQCPWHSTKLSATPLERMKRTEGNKTKKEACNKTNIDYFLSFLSCVTEQQLG